MTGNKPHFCQPEAKKVQSSQALTRRLLPRIPDVNILDDIVSFKNYWMGTVVIPFSDESPASRSLRCISLLLCSFLCLRASYGQPDTVDRSIDGHDQYRGHITIIAATSPPNEEDVSSFVVLSLNPVTLKQTTLVDLGDVAVLPGRVSPDSQRLAFSVVSMTGLRKEGVHRKHEMSIWVVNSKRQIEELDEKGLFVAWSPDGRSLIAYRDDSRHVDTFTIDLMTKEIKPFFVPPGELLRDVSPDGSMLATVSRKGVDASLNDSVPSYQMFITWADTLTRKHERLFASKPEKSCNGPRFSPDGRSVAYYEMRSEMGKTVAYGMLADADGANERQVVQLYEPTRQPLRHKVFPSCWSPDGTRVVWHVSSEPEGELGQASNELVFAAANGNKTTRKPLNQENVWWWGPLDWR